MNQAQFAAALLDPAAAVPQGLVGPDGNAAPKRFDVYRNNVVLSLTRVLEAAFPAVRKVVGEAFFAAMAGVFVRAHPPGSRIMMLYGEAFAGFLATFPPVAHLGYLPDLARLEQALRESYHAADGAPADPSVLIGLDETRLLAARLVLAPSLRLVRSDWPVLSIWRANCQAGPAPVMGAEEVAILRPEFDPKPCLLPKGGVGFLTALIAGQTLQQALQGVPEGFDLPAALTVLLSGQAIMEVRS